MPYFGDPQSASSAMIGWIASELQDSGELLRVLFEGHPDMVFLTDEQTHIVGANAGAMSGLGYRREQLEGQPIEMLLPEAERARHAESAHKFMHQPTARAMGSGLDVKARDASGREFRVDVLLHPWSCAGRQYVMAVCRRMDTLQAHQQTLLHALIESVTDYAIYMLSPTGVIVSWNKGAEHLTGYQGHEVLGKNFSIFFLPAEAAVGVPAAELEVATREGRAEVESWRRRKCDTPFWALVTLTAIRGGGGELRGFAKVTRDMSAHKAADEARRAQNVELEERVARRTQELQASVEELQRKNQEAEAFVYTVSHDLRAPLVNVQGFVRELEESCKKLKMVLQGRQRESLNWPEIGSILDEEMGGALRYIAASTAKFDRLIGALLGLSRQGRQVYRLERVNAWELATSAVANLQQRIAETGTEVEVGALPAAMADTTALGQVFSNLIGNSLKYRDPKRPLRIEVGGQLEGGTAHYWVRDNGLGIPESGMNKLFQVFQRFHVQRAEGEGMGLAIVHRIVERHGGKIWAESRVGEGTTFHFTIPAFVQASAAGGTA